MKSFGVALFAVAAMANTHGGHDEPMGVIKDEYNKGGYSAEYGKDYEQPRYGKDYDSYDPKYEPKYEPVKGYDTYDPKYEPPKGYGDDYGVVPKNYKSQSLADFVDLYFSQLLDFLNDSVHRPDCKKSATKLARFYSKDATQFALLTVQEGRKEIRQFFIIVCELLNALFGKYGIFGRLFNVNFEYGSVFSLRYAEDKKIAHTSFVYELVVGITSKRFPNFGFDFVIPVRETLNLDRVIPSYGDNKGYDRKLQYNMFEWEITHSHESVDVEGIFTQAERMVAELKVLDPTMELGSLENRELIKEMMIPLMSHDFSSQSRQRTTGLGLSGM